MTAHEEHFSKISHYVQDELAGEKLEEFQAHLVTCAACTAELEQEKALSALLRQLSPLYEVSAECAECVHELLAAPCAVQPVMPAAQSRQVANTRGWLRLPRWRLLIAAATVIVLFFLIQPIMVRQARADSYVNAAVTSHHQVVEDRLSFGIRSNSAKEVTAWIAGRVPFNFRLPIPANTRPIQPAYRLAGASLINFREHPAALVTYERQRDKVTLLVASNRYATVAGGNRIRHQNLIFHYFTVDGATVTTWSNHGLSYALVTSNSSAEQDLKPCLVCHQDIPDRRLFQVLRQH